MFFASVFIIIGVLLLLSALGISISSNLWTLFWAILFLAIGFRLLWGRGRHPFYRWGYWEEKIDEKIRRKMHNQDNSENK